MMQTEPFSEESMLQSIDFNYDFTKKLIWKVGMENTYLEIKTTQIYFLMG